MKKLLISLGLVGTTFAPAMTLVSCGSSSTSIIINEDHTVLLSRMFSSVMQPLAYFAKSNAQSWTEPAQSTVTKLTIHEFSTTGNSIIEFTYAGENAITLKSDVKIEKNSKVKFVITNNKPVAADKYVAANMDNNSADKVLKVELYIADKKIDGTTFMVKAFRDYLGLMKEAAKSYNTLIAKKDMGWTKELINNLTEIIFSGNVHLLGKDANNANNILSTASEMGTLFSEISKLTIVGHMSDAAQEVFAFSGDLSGKYLGKSNDASKTTHDEITKSKLKTLLSLDDAKVGKVSYVLKYSKTTHTFIGVRFYPADDKIYTNITSTPTSN